MKLNQFIESIRLKYDLKREYFTVGIPVIMAIALLLFALLTGHTFVDDKKSVSMSSEEDARQKAYEELLKQLAEEEGGESVELPGATEPEEESEDEKPPSKADMDHYLIYAFVIAITPYSIDRYFLKRLHSKNEEDFSQFLFKLSEMMRAGIDPVKSVIELSKTDLGTITSNMRIAAATMILGGSFEEGMKKVAASLNSELISRYIDLVISASYTGGAVSDLILKASEDMRSMILIEKEMIGSLKQYTLIFYFAQCILVAMAFILLTTLFPSLVSDSASAALGGEGLKNIDFTKGFFHLIIINAVIGGIIIGKISEGSALDGLKHSVILTAGCYLFCVFFLLPGAASQDAVTITVISGQGQEGIGGLPLQQPVVFKVIDKDGKPKPDIFLSVSVKPSGKINPAMIKTNKEGEASVNIVLGEESGTYTIEAKAGDYTAKATAIVGNS